LVGNSLWKKKQDGESARKGSDCAWVPSDGQRAQPRGSLGALSRELDHVNRVARASVGPAAPNRGNGTHQTTAKAASPACRKKHWGKLINRAIPLKRKGESGGYQKEKATRRRTLHKCVRMRGGVVDANPQRKGKGFFVVSVKDSVTRGAMPGGLSP